MQESASRAVSGPAASVFIAKCIIGEAASAATLKPAPWSLPGFCLSRGIPRDPSVNRGGRRNPNAGRGAPRDRGVGRGEIGVPR
ncbi:hypothetical protein NDU88_006982 [Pleurodeles waltl]|uniref:Uncharacterized protein n=1 Tax=Pleurodeles waltl TaxID=8319 RepID=A0AAV7N549_PLEWA|nr:hypothetical protein NDU88_006982 [Pleurodeles waltl]